MSTVVRYEGEINTQRKVRVPKWYHVRSLEAVHVSFAGLEYLARIKPVVNSVVSNLKVVELKVPTHPCR